MPGSARSMTRSNRGLDPSHGSGEPATVRVLPGRESVAVA